MRTTGLILIIVVLALAATITHAATFQVKQDGTGDYTAIQAAIDAASDGDEIIVYPGTYYENVEIGGRNIILRSTAPWDPNVVNSTILDGCRRGAVVLFNGSERASCMLSGLTITNGRSDGGGGICGAQVQYPHNNTAAISNCLITLNRGFVGGGVAYCGGIISNCIITDNSPASLPSYEGGGLFGCDGEITGCVISGHSAYAGAGLCGCAGRISHCVIRENSSDCGAGIRWGPSDTGGILNCLIADSSGSAVKFCDGPITNCTFIGNSTVALEWCSGDIANSILWGNNLSYDDQLPGCRIPRYSCIEYWAGGGEGNISFGPQFVSGPFGNYYLSQTAAGQLVNSPCVDAGSGSASDNDMDCYTTRTDGVLDSGRVDMGFHYPNYVRAGVEHYEKWNDIEAYGPGDTVRVFMRLENYGVPRTIDIYLGVVEPNGRVWTYTQGGFRAGNHAWYRGVQLPAPFSYPWLEALQIQLPDAVSPGTYFLAIGIPETGSQLTLDDITYTSFDVAGE